MLAASPRHCATASLTTIPISTRPFPLTHLRVRFLPLATRNSGGTSRRYNIAYYFSIVTITTVGFGDVSTSTTHERLYIVGVMFFGTAAFAFVTGQVA